MHIKKKVGVAFLWHMHQPFYKDPLSGQYLLPWVRLHGIKDYFPMAVLVENFTNVNVTFNMVPSLVEQINDYAQRDASDLLLDLTVKRASDLSFEDKVDILNNFFKVNYKRFVEPNDRYTDLLLKKGLGALTGDEVTQAVSSFSAQDYLDLQVLFNLAWFHSISIDEDINLRDIVSKKRQYTEEDKEYIVQKQKEILRQIIPLYRRLAERGQVELTTTPYFHPILPLICDTDIGRVSLPKHPMPEPHFSHPEDAAWHIEEAIRYHAEQFGQPPQGMWPSEGSVSDAALQNIASKGIKWVATDEDILYESIALQPKHGKEKIVDERDDLYRPFLYKRDGTELSMIFRDKNLSNMISFNYHEWDQGKAVDDLIGHFKRIAGSVKNSRKALITIAMDGENAWEFYPDNGRQFFEKLYGRLDACDDFCSTTVSDYLEADPPRKTLSTIFPGSWINHNFEVWIGQEQDNVSWGYLKNVRNDLIRFTKEYEKNIRNNPLKIQQAWRELYIAEGSDWNWWYAGEAHLGSENPFDPIYRTHLANIYRILGKPVPEFL